MACARIVPVGMLHLSPLHDFMGEFQLGGRGDARFANGCDHLVRGGVHPAFGKPFGGGNPFACAGG